MRTAQFITRLEVETVPVGNLADGAHYFRMQNAAMVGEDEYAELPVAVTRKVAPIHRLCRGHGSEMLIAYSDEVQDLLKLPFDVYQQELADARALHSRLRGEASLLKERLGAFEGMTLWSRLKYLFTGRA